MTSTDYLLPVMPFGSPEYTIVCWLKRPGDSVEAGEPLLVILNGQVEVALPATYAGIFEQELSGQGATVAAEARVATIATMRSGNSVDVPSAVQSAAIEPGHGAGSAPDNHKLSERPLRISPVARRIARLAKVDITQLRGSGVSGCIVKADVLALLASQTPQNEHQVSPASPITLSLIHI